MLAAGAAFLLTAGVAVAGYIYTGRSSKQGAAEESKEAAAPSTPQAALPVVEEAKEEESAAAVEVDWLGFEDPGFDSQQYLSKIEASSRSDFIEDVSY